jgi:Tfp pilus assembly protein PilO
MKQDGSWHLDKRVPVALILALLVQFAGGIWFISSLAKDVATHERQITRLDGQIEVIRNSSQRQAVQLGRIEEQVTGMRNDIRNLLRAMERGYQ